MNSIPWLCFAKQMSKYPWFFTDYGIIDRGSKLLWFVLDYISAHIQPNVTKRIEWALTVQIKKEWSEPNSRLLESMETAVAFQNLVRFWLKLL